MKIYGIPNKKMMEEERKRMKRSGKISHSVQSDMEQTHFADNKPSLHTEINTDVDLTFERDKWTPCGQ